MQNENFGSLLRKYRESSYDSLKEKHFSQERLAESLSTYPKVRINRNHISKWENNEDTIHHIQERHILIALIDIFIQSGTITSIQQANEFLVSGQYMPLEDHEINSKWLEKGYINANEDPELQKIPIPPADFTNLAPAAPALVIGREEAILNVKNRLGIARGGKKIKANDPITVIQGWPGVGKTTLTSLIAHDPDIQNAYPDGVLWAALNPTPNLMSELSRWGRAVGLDHLIRSDNLAQAVKQLTVKLRDKAFLLIVDDAWKAEDVLPFKVGGEHCALIVTTRINEVAHEVVQLPHQIFNLEILTVEAALDLLGHLAPNVCKKYPEEAKKLVEELEQLPLAIQVAGRLLQEEELAGLNIIQLIEEIKEGEKLLAAKAPADRFDLANQTIPSVAALLQKSTDYLSPEIREKFAFLAPFAPKPATFDLAAMASVWQVNDPSNIVRILVARGLLEKIPDENRYQMHALLVMHANALLEEM